MTLYAIYNPDGSISQANKVYDPDGLNYDKLLNDRSLKFVKDSQAEHLCSHYHWMVDVTAQQIKERPVISAFPYAKTVKAGTSAIVCGIPKGAAVSVQAAGSVVYSVPSIAGDELELITEPVPCTYTFVIRLWPFKDCAVNIEAVAA